MCVVALVKLRELMDLKDGVIATSPSEALWRGWHHEIPEGKGCERRAKRCVEHWGAGKAVFMCMHGRRPRGALHVGVDPEVC